MRATDTSTRYHTPQSLALLDAGAVCRLRTIGHLADGADPLSSVQVGRAVDGGDCAAVGLLRDPLRIMWL